MGILNKKTFLTLFLILNLNIFAEKNMYSKNNDPNLKHQEFNKIEFQKFEANSNYGTSINQNLKSNKQQIKLIESKDENSEDVFNNIYSLDFKTIKKDHNYDRLLKQYNKFYPNIKIVNKFNKNSNKGAVYTDNITLTKQQITDYEIKFQSEISKFTITNEEKKAFFFILSESEISTFIANSAKFENFLKEQINILSKIKKMSVEEVQKNYINFFINQKNKNDFEIDNIGSLYFEILNDKSKIDLDNRCKEQLSLSKGIEQKLKLFRDEKFVADFLNDLKEEQNMLEELAEEIKKFKEAFNQVPNKKQLSIMQNIISKKYINQENEKSRKETQKEGEEQNKINSQKKINEQKKINNSNQIKNQLLYNFINNNEIDFFNKNKYKNKILILSINSEINKANKNDKSFNSNILNGNIKYNAIFDFLNLIELKISPLINIVFLKNNLKDLTSNNQSLLFNLGYNFETKVNIADTVIFNMFLQRNFGFAQNNKNNLLFNNNVNQIAGVQCILNLAIFPKYLRFVTKISTYQIVLGNNNHKKIIFLNKNDSCFLARLESSLMFRFSNALSFNAGFFINYSIKNTKENTLKNEKGLLLSSIFFDKIELNATTFFDLSKNINKIKNNIYNFKANLELKVYL